MTKALIRHWLNFCLLSSVCAFTRYYNKFRDTKAHNMQTKSNVLMRNIVKKRMICKENKRRNRTTVVNMDENIKNGLSNSQRWHEHCTGYLIKEKKIHVWLILKIYLIFLYSSIILIFNFFFIMSNMCTARNFYNKIINFPFPTRKLHFCSELDFSGKLLWE